MKKHLLILLGLAYNIAIFKAQDLLYEENSALNNHVRDVRDQIREEINELNLLHDATKKIKRVETINSRKNKRNYEFTYELNKEENLIAFKNEFVTRYLFFKIKRHLYLGYDYLDNALSSFSILDKKGNVLSTKTYSYFAPNKIKLVQKFAKGTLVSESSSNYNPDSTIKEWIRYKIKNNHKKLRNRYEFDYYSDKARKQTRLYNRRNKLKHVWNYDCNPKGEIQHAKQTNICKNTGTDYRGRLIETTFNSSDKDFKTKTVNTYYLINQEKVISTSERYKIKRNKERKLYDTHYADSIEPYYSSTYYDKKGLIASQWRNDYFNYSTQSKILKEKSFKSYNHSKLTFTYITMYNTRGLPLKTEIQNKKGRIIGSSETMFYGDSLILSNHFNKKHRLKNTCTTRISYH